MWFSQSVFDYKIYIMFYILGIYLVQSMRYKPLKKHQACNEFLRIIQRKLVFDRLQSWPAKLFACLMEARTKPLGTTLFLDEKIVDFWKKKNFDRHLREILMSIVFLVFNMMYCEVLNDCYVWNVWWFWVHYAQRYTKRSVTYNTNKQTNPHININNKA